ncbi:MAG: tetratricopeptide repeat protein [Chlorobium sp.]|nr:MAG: tetratricopeptide repeat protein [Chlorobium sp.]
MNHSIPHSKTGWHSFIALILIIGLGLLSSCNSKPDEINSLQQQVWKTPQDARAYMKLGNAYANSKRFPEASQAFNSALAINPELDDARHALGAVAFNQKNYTEALKFFQQNLDRSPKDSLRLYDLGNVYMQLKQFDKAANLYNAAIDNSESFIEAHYNLAVCYSHTGRKSDAEAIYKWLLDKNNYLAVSLQKHINNEAR